MRRGESHLCSAASLSHNFSSTQARLPSHSHVTCVQIFSSMPHHRDRHYDLLPLSFDGPTKRGCARPPPLHSAHLVCLLPACCCCVQAHLVASPFCASGARAQIVDAKRSGRRQRATIIIFQRPDAKVRQAHCARTPASHACCPCVALPHFHSSSVQVYSMLHRQVFHHEPRLLLFIVSAPFTATLIAPSAMFAT